MVYDPIVGFNMFLCSYFNPSVFSDLMTMKTLNATIEFYLEELS